MKCKRKRVLCKRLSLKITLLILIIFLNQTVRAQYPDLEFKNFSKNDGLSVVFITSILQDREGFIWFGTYGGGINRYDGYNFKVYQNVINKTGSLNYSFCETIYEDRNGIIWIGTVKEGLSRFDKNKEQFKNYSNNNDSGSISGNTVNAIYMDKEGVLWIGCELYGLNKFDERSNRFIHYRHNINDKSTLSGHSVTAICEDNTGNLWIGTDKGLNRFDRCNGTFYHYTIKGGNGSGSEDYNNITRCVYDEKENAIWIGTAKGLYKLVYINEQEYFVKNYNLNNNNDIHITSIHRDKNGFLWIGTARKGLFILNPETEKFTNFKYKPDNPSCIINDKISSNRIIEDKSGNFWIGTNYGVSMCRKHNKNFRFYRYNESISGWTVFEDKKNNIWITGRDNFHIRDKSGIFKIVSYDPPAKPFITRKWGYKGICDKSGVIWLGYQNVLCKYEKETGVMNHFYTLPDSGNSQKPIIKVLFEDSDSLLWIGTTEGVWVFNQERTNAVKYVHNINDTNSIGSNETHCCIYEDRNKGIWISLFNKGVDRFDKKTGRFQHYRNNPSDSNSLGNNIVCSLYDDGKGSIWIAACKGLDKLDVNTNTFSHYTQKDGLADDYTYSILPDDSGNLWISTNIGISKFNPDSKIFINYNTSDGLQNDEFTDIACRTSKGELFFCNMKGIISFFPDSIIDNKHIPSVFITSFRIFDNEALLDKPVTKTDEIRLSFKENFFSLEFAALDYTNPQKNQYKYILEGVDNEWRNSGNIRTVNYTNISPGEYVFRVKGSNNDGVWNEAGTSVRIIIAPPWWAAWWFKSTVIILVAGIIGLSFYRHSHTIKKEKKQQEDFTRQIISAHEDERKRISKELHDSLGQNLLIVKNLSLLGIKHPERNPELFDNIEKLSSSIIHEVRNIAYNLYPYQLERLGLTKALESITERALKSSEIKFTKEIETIDNIFSHDGEINIFRIVQECINNIVKHSGAKRASLKIKNTGRDLLITISDNGKGFDVNEILSDKSKTGIGLINMKERLKLLDGIFEIKSAPGKGTKFKIKIPLIEVYKTL